jgi:hypothetical protein
MTKKSFLWLAVAIAFGWFFVGKIDDFLGISLSFGNYGEIGAVIHAGIFMIWGACLFDIIKSSKSSREEFDAVEERKNRSMKVPAFLILGLGIILGIWSWTDYSRTEAVRTTGTYPQEQLDAMRTSETVDGCVGVAAVACLVGTGILLTRKQT